jgi:hypothetical protein
LGCTRHSIPLEMQGVGIDVIEAGLIPHPIDPDDLLCLQLLEGALDMAFT